MSNLRKKKLKKKHSSFTPYEEKKDNKKKTSTYMMYGYGHMDVHFLKVKRMISSLKTLNLLENNDQVLSYRKTLNIPMKEEFENFVA